MSPEQVEGSKSIDHRTDLWALAVITFECVTGVRPFESETLGALLLQICAKPITVPSQHGPVPAGFDAWFARATQRVPSERFQSAREMVDALRVVLTPGAGVQAVLPTPPRGTLGTAKQAVDAWSMSLQEAAVSSVQAARSRRRTLPLLIAGACLLLLVAAVLLLGRSRDAAQPEDKAQPHLVRPAQAPSPAVPSPSAAAHATTPAAAPAAPAPLAPTPVAPAPAAAPPPKAAPDTDTAPRHPQPAIRGHAASARERAKPRPSAPASSALHPAPVSAPAAAPSIPKPARPQAKPADLGF
jgi:serine/threonine-protein kinase